MTSNGANAKDAVTAKLPWQDNVNAARRSLAYTYSLQISSCRTLAHDWTEGLQGSGRGTTNETK